MTDLILNINDYDLKDIETIFRLKKNYTIDDINDMYNKKLKECKKNNMSIEIITFFSSIKDKLLNESNVLINQSQEINKTKTIYAGNTYVLDKNTTYIDNIINPSSTLNPIEVNNTNLSRSQLNPIKRKTKLVTLVFNTSNIKKNCNTNCNNNNNFIFTLPIMFKQVISMRLSSIQLPNTLYTFTNHKKNNKFYIKEQTTGNNGLIIIEEGNYTSEEIGFYLTDLINTTLNTIDRFLVTLSNNTGKICFSNSTNKFTLFFYDETIDGINENKNNNCGSILGFCNYSYLNNDIYVGNTLYNPNIYNYIYLCLNDFNKSQYETIIGILENSVIDDNILALIPITANFFNYNFDNGSDFIEKKREYFGPINLVKIQVSIKDEMGDIIYLNGQNFSFSLELELAYDW
jgi:hypothetical protein